MGLPPHPHHPTLPGATYGSFPAACHYQDGSFVFARVQELCAHHNTGARFTFWHPDLVTLHIWLWYPNPAGLYNGTNPLIQPSTPPNPPRQAGARPAPGWVPARRSGLPLVFSALRGRGRACRGGGRPD
jgi:hypothetical protein